MDVAGIEAGRDFRKAIEESVANCGVLLVVMGPSWLTAANERGARRLDDPADFVREEVASALRRDIPVIPVLVRGATMPRVEDLPDDLKDLAYRNCVELTHARWRSDVQLLLEPLRRLIGNSAEIKARSSTGGAKLAAEPQQSTQEASAPASADRATASRFDADTLQHIRRELVLYVGPIAEFVLSRAARLSRSTDELLVKVAEEIESPQQREEFLRKMNSPVSSDVSLAASAPAPMSRSGNTPPVDDIDAQFQTPAPQALPASRSKSALLLIVIAAIAGLLFLLVKHMQGPGHSASFSAGHESSPEQSKPVPAPDKVQFPEQSPVPDPKLLAASRPVASVAEQRVSVAPPISQALLLTKVVPMYPPLARQARIQGEVVLDAIISRDGTVERLTVLSGHPMLVPAAIDAVKQWRYRPYVVAGRPVPIETHVTVNFSLVKD